MPAVYGCATRPKPEQIGCPLKASLPVRWSNTCVHHRMMTSNDHLAAPAEPSRHPPPVGGMGGGRLGGPPHWCHYTSRTPPVVWCHPGPPPGVCTCRPCGSCSRGPQVSQKEQSPPQLWDALYQTGDSTRVEAGLARQVLLPVMLPSESLSTCCCMSGSLVFTAIQPKPVE